MNQDQAKEVVEAMCKLISSMTTSEGMYTLVVARAATALEVALVGGDKLEDRHDNLLRRNTKTEKELAVAKAAIGIGPADFLTDAIRNLMDTNNQLAQQVDRLTKELTEANTKHVDALRRAAKARAVLAGETEA